MGLLLLLAAVVCCFCAMWKATERPARPAPIMTTSFGIAALLLFLISSAAVVDEDNFRLVVVAVVAILYWDGLYDENTVGLGIDLVGMAVVEGMKEKA